VIKFSISFLFLLPIYTTSILASAPTPTSYSSKEDMKAVSELLLSRLGPTADHPSLLMFHSIIDQKLALPPSPDASPLNIDAFLSDMRFCKIFTLAQLIKHSETALREKTAYSEQIGIEAEMLKTHFRNLKEQSALLPNYRHLFRNYLIAFVKAGEAFSHLAALYSGGLSRDKAYWQCLEYFRVATGTFDAYRELLGTEPDPGFENLALTVHAQIYFIPSVSKNVKDDSLRYIGLYDHKKEYSSITGVQMEAHNREATARAAYMEKLERASKGGRLGKLARKKARDEQVAANLKLAECAATYLSETAPARPRLLIQETAVQAQLIDDFENKPLPELLDLEKKVVDFETALLTAFQDDMKAAREAPLQLIDAYNYLETLSEAPKKNKIEKIQNIALRSTVLFLSLGKYSDAKERFQACLEYVRLRMPTPADFNLASAYFDALTGNPTKLLELINQKKSGAAKKRAAKAKEAALLATSTAEPESDEDDKTPKRSQPKAMPSQVLSTVSDYVDDVPTALSKAEKRRRHKEAVKKREEAAAACAVRPRIAEPEKKLPDSDDEEETSSAVPVTRTVVVENFSLVDLFGLKSRSKEVDDSISSGAWDFTRDQFTTYMTTGLGCSHRTGKGVHEVVSIPDIFEKNGQPIFIFLQLGGSLTLPKWDGDFVPYYLRPQIQTMRKKLYDFKLAEVAATRTAASLSLRTDIEGEE
jgi:hypothetical protein